jgi:Ion channel
MVAAFYAFTVANVLGYVLGSGPVTGDKLHAAVAAYILTALLWTALYALVDHLVPGSFSVRGTSDLDAPLRWKELLFFSFTTLTSTGYGRIVPIADHTQSLAILEQLAGVFYVAILIARLAGLYQPGASRRSKWRISGTDGVARSERKGRAKRRLLRVVARLVQNDQRD